MSKRFDDKIVWITGGGSGIGKALAVELARRGAHVAVSGRRLERLTDAVEQIEAQGRRALAVQCDVTDEDDVAAAVRTVVEELGRLDVAIANAGWSANGRIEDLPVDVWRRQFEVNVIGVASTIHHAMPQLRETNGRMVLIGSVAGCVSTPNVGAYNATKYAVRAIGQTLSMELAGSGVSCTTIQPGLVQSEIALVDNEGEMHEEWNDRRPQQLMWSAEKAARTMADAIWSRKREFTFTAHGKLGAFLGKHAPGLVHHAITKIGYEG